MWRANADHDAGLADLQTSSAMHNAEVRDVEFLMSLRSKPLQFTNCHRFVRFVDEVERAPAFRPFTRITIERYGGAAARENDPARDRWEFEAVREALSRGLPIFAICKGLQVFNVALGGTLKLDIKGHNLPEQRDREVQPLRHARRAAHRFSKVNSAHHQAIEQLGNDLEVEAWSAHDGIVEQVRLRKYPFARAVQYHPERSRVYDGLFEEFFSRLNAVGTNG